MGAGHRPVAAQPHGRFSPSEIPTARLFRKVSSTTCIGVLRRSAVIFLPDLGVQRPALSGRSLVKPLVLFPLRMSGQNECPYRTVFMVGAVFSALDVLLDAFECEICSHPVGKVPRDGLAVSVHRTKTFLIKAHQPASSLFFVYYQHLAKNMPCAIFDASPVLVPPEVVRYCCFPSALPLTFRR